MSEPTPPPERSEPATGPVYTGPPTSETAPGPAPSGPAGPSPQVGAGAPGPAPIPHTVYVAAPPSRLSKVAAWVGIVAGSVFVVAVIFGAGVFVGKQSGHGPGHHRGAEMFMRPGPPGFPAGPPGGFDRGPNYSGPFGPGTPIIELPRSPGGPPAGGPRGGDYGPPDGPPGR